MYQIKLYSPHGPTAWSHMLCWQKNLNRANFLSKKHYLENKKVICHFRNSADWDQLTYNKPADQDLFFIIHMSYAGNLCKIFRTRSGSKLGG